MSDEWYYRERGERRGPVSAAKLKALATEGWIAPGDLVWQEGMPEWVQAGSVRGLFPNPLVRALSGGIVGVPPPPAAAAVAAAPPPLPAGNVVVINEPPVQRWSPALAAVLSFLIPGLGQLYKGQILNAIVWFFVVGLGYVALILPGLVLHLCCILGAASGNPWTAGRTTVLRQ